jgi:hypothetical protein
MEENNISPAVAAVIALVYLGTILILGIFLAIGNAGLARRLGKNQAIWVILTLIPGINFIFMYYVLYQIVYGILDRLPPPRTI